VVLCGHAAYTDPGHQRLTHRIADLLAFGVLRLTVSEGCVQLAFMRWTLQACTSWQSVHCLSLLILSLAEAFPRALRIVGRDFVSDTGQIVQLHAGEMHYFRVPEVYWEDRLKRLRAMGLNAVSTYIAWNWHETTEGSFDFASDRKDVAKFLKLARQQGLLVIFRPGPYICAEWDFGGMPAWLLGRALRENFNLRTGDQRYLHFVDRFWGELLPRVRPELLENGGALAVLQLENEYGHWGDANQPSDRAYFEHLRSLARRHLGPGVLLITTDDDEAVARGRGGLPDVFAAVNFGPWEADARKHLDKVFANARLHNGEAPELVMELWSGWFQMWQHDENTKKQFKVAGKQLLDYVAALLERNASFTLYMAHGGTNFGLWPSAGFTMPEMGASFKWTSAFVSTSYDYAAPIAEDGRHGFGGDGVDKYAGLRSLLASHQSPDDPLPEEPALPRFASYSGQGPSGEVPLRRRAPLRDPAALEALRQGEAWALGGEPEAMELQGQQGGVALYRHRPADPDALRRAVARWHSEGSGRAPLLWPRMAVAVLAAAAGTTFMWRHLRCCRCCSVCAAIFVAVAFNVHDRWSKPDEAPLVLLARDRVTVWQGEALVLKPYLNIEHTCCPWQVRDLAVNVMPDGPGTLDVLVENLGRRAFMPRGYIGEGAGLRHIWYDWKGLVSARIGSEPLAGQWELHVLPLADLHGLNGSAPPPSEPQAAAPAPQGSGPTFFEGQFFVPEDDAGPADSYLCLEAGPWSTGVAYVNGFNLGRYWRGAAAPLDLYVPKSALHQGRNVVVLLEMEPPVTEEGAVLSLKAARG